MKRRKFVVTAVTAAAGIVGIRKLTAAEPEARNPTVEKLDLSPEEWQQRLTPADAQGEGSPQQRAARHHAARPVAVLPAPCRYRDQARDQ